MQAQLPDKGKWPKLDSYDWTLDPDMHIKAYMIQASLFFDGLRVHCRLFPTTLKGTILYRYYILPQNSIDSFRTLCDKFIARFVDSKPIATSSTLLQHVIQGKGELLNNICLSLQRFVLIYLTYTQILMHSLTVGLRLSLFLNTLFVEPPNNMNKLRARATKYIIIVENTQVVKRLEIPLKTYAPKRKRLDSFDSYTPLNVNRDIVIQEAYNLEHVHLPQPMQTSPSTDHTKICYYHQNYGHSTKECIKVRDMNEELILLDSLADLFHIVKVEKAEEDTKMTKVETDRAKADSRREHEVVTKYK